MSARRISEPRPQRTKCDSLWGQHESLQKQCSITPHVCFWPMALAMYFRKSFAFLRFAFIPQDAWEGKNSSQTQNVPPVERGL